MLDQEINQALRHASSGSPSELSGDFSDQVMARIDEAMVARTDSIHTWMTAAGGALAAIVVTMMSTSPKEEVPPLRAFNLEATSMSMLTAPHDH